MSHKRLLFPAAALVLALACTAGIAQTDDDQGSNECKGLPGHGALQAALAVWTRPPAVTVQGNLMDCRYQPQICIPRCSRAGAYSVWWRRIL
jgi:hypothetical protein